MKLRLLSLSVFLLVFGFVLVGCHYGIPPSIETVQTHFDDNFEDVRNVVSFLQDAEYKNIYITEPNGTMNADLNIVSISDPIIIDTVNRLLGGNHYYSISKRGDTICFLQWKGFIRDIGCGIAYTTVGIDLPEIEYCTQLLPLSNTGWFYYVSDYELWRRSQ